MPKEKKSPPNTPSVGDKVVMRGRRDATGTLTAINDETKWSRVAWDAAGAGPLLCHLFELEKAQ